MSMSHPVMTTESQVPTEPTNWRTKKTCSGCGRMFSPSLKSEKHHLYWKQDERRQNCRRYHSKLCRPDETPCNPKEKVCKGCHVIFHHPIGGGRSGQSVEDCFSEIPPQQLLRVQRAIQTSRGKLANNPHVASWIAWMLEREADSVAKYLSQASQKGEIIRVAA